MRRLTQAEVLLFIEGTYDQSPDEIASQMITAYIGGYDMAEVITDLESFIATFDDVIDIDSFTIAPDHIDGMDLPACQITIKTEETS